MSEASCPRCGHVPVLRIMYGLPEFPPPDDVILGGCIEFPDNPSHGCETCGWRGTSDELDDPDR